MKNTHCILKMDENVFKKHILVLFLFCFCSVETKIQTGKEGHGFVGFWESLHMYKSIPFQTQHRKMCNTYIITLVLVCFGRNKFGTLVDMKWEDEVILIKIMLQGESIKFFSCMPKSASCTFRTVELAFSHCRNIHHSIFSLLHFHCCLHFMKKLPLNMSLLKKSFS